jgi:DNA-binding transcriptional regulator YdaS (Cro superfamily)
MKLRAYTSSVEPASRLAERLGFSPVLLSQWGTGKRQVPAEHCPAIERATGGAVRCEDLRPDVEWSVLRVVAADQVAA